MKKDIKFIFTNILTQLKVKLSFKFQPYTIFMWLLFINIRALKTLQF